MRIADRHGSALALTRHYALDSKRQNIIVYVFDVTKDPETYDGELLSIVDQLRRESRENVEFRQCPTEL